MEERPRFRISKNAMDPEPVLESLWAMNAGLSRLRWELVAQVRATNMDAEGDSQSGDQAMRRLPFLRAELCRVNECTQPFLDHVNAIFPFRTVEPKLATSEPTFTIVGSQPEEPVFSRDAANAQTALLYLDELVKTANVEAFLEEASEDPLLRDCSLAAQAFVVNYETIDHARALVLDLRVVCGVILRAWEEAETQAVKQVLAPRRSWFPRASWRTRST